MSNYALSQIDCRRGSSTLLQHSFVELLRSLSQRIHPFFWHVNGESDQEDALCNFLNIEHSQYLLLLEYCGYGDVLTKVSTSELAEIVGKEYCEFSEYTLRKAKTRSTRWYIRLGCKTRNTNEVKEKVKNQFKKGELAVFPKKLIHTCRLNKNELSKINSLTWIPLREIQNENVEPPVQAQLPRTCEQQEPEMTRSSHKQATL